MRSTSGRRYGALPAIKNNTPLATVSHILSPSRWGRILFLHRVSGVRRCVAVRGNSIRSCLLPLVYGAGRICARSEWTPTRPFVVEAFGKCEGLSRIAILEGANVAMIAKVTKVKFAEDIAKKK